MEITITGRHFDISDSIRNYAVEKIEKFERIYNGITLVEALLKGEDRTFHCEIIIHVGNKPNIVVDVSHDSMYAAIDLATDKAVRQIRKAKEKIKDHRPKVSVASEGEEPVEDVDDFDTE